MCLCTSGLLTVGLGVDTLDGDDLTVEDNGVLGFVPFWHKQTSDMTL